MRSYFEHLLQYGMHEGTSQSAGYVAGGAALLLAAYRAAGFPNMTGALVRDALMSGVVQTDNLADKCQSGECREIKLRP